jgi:hypothetical protein
MTAIYPNDAVFNVNNFSTTGSVQYNGTGTTTEFILPTSVTNVGQVLPFADGVLQDATTYGLSSFNGINYSNVAFNAPLYASNLTLKTISVPNYFFINQFAISPSVLDFSNTVPVVIRGNTYVVNNTRTTFPLPLNANGSSKDSILLIRNGVAQAQDQFTYPSATLGIYGVDMLDAPHNDETLEIRYFDSGTNKYTRMTSMASRKVDKGFSYTKEPEVKSTKFIAGYEKRRLITRRLKRKWTCSYTNINGIMKEAIENFYFARSGTFEAFSLDLSHLNEQGLVTVVFDGAPNINNVLGGSTNDMTQNFYTINLNFREVDD